MPKPTGTRENDALSNTQALYVLVADDDAASRRFLVDALRALGVRAIACADGTEAIARAGEESFDLLLLDCRMPGAGALEVLTALRADEGAQSSDAVAVATTAELSPGNRKQLLAAGFSDILLKPCQWNDLEGVLALAPPGLKRLPMLDDEAALTATGDSNTMRALRQLLQDELLAVCGELDHLATDNGAFRDRLHRLRSSCGFCGAKALSSQVTVLQRHLALGRGHAAAPVARFRKVLIATLEALNRPGASA